MKKILVLTSLFLVAMPMTATAHPRGPATIAYRITQSPEFNDGPEGECQFNGVVAIEDLDGSPLGTTRLCVQRSKALPGNRFVDRGQLTVDLAGGRIEFDVTFTDTYNADFTAASHQAQGQITGGHGRYTGAKGSLSGSGVILFDDTGTPMPLLTYEVKLRNRG